MSRASRLRAWIAREIDSGSWTGYVILSFLIAGPFWVLVLVLGVTHG